MTITPRSVQKWVQERVQNDPYNLHAKNPCGFHATLFVQRLIYLLRLPSRLRMHFMLSLRQGKMHYNQRFA